VHKSSQKNSENHFWYWLTEKKTLQNQIKNPGWIPSWDPPAKVGRWPHLCFQPTQKPGSDEQPHGHLPIIPHHSDFRGALSKEKNATATWVHLPSFCRSRVVSLEVRVGTWKWLSEFFTSVSDYTVVPKWIYPNSFFLIFLYPISHPYLTISATFVFE